KEPLGAITGAKARVEPDEKPSELELKLALVHETELYVQAKGYTPAQPEWERRPVQGSIELRDLDAEVFRALGLDDVAEDWRGPLNAHGEGKGPPRALETKVELASNAGPLELAMALENFDAVRLQAASRGIRPAALYQAAPDRLFTFQVDAET